MLLLREFVVVFAAGIIIIIRTNRRTISIRNLQNWETISGDLWNWRKIARILLELEIARVLKEGVQVRQ